jgi:ribonuclease J
MDHGRSWRDLWPCADYPGIELIMPDLEFIEDRKDDLLGIVLTHGHEDHIGAVPYLAADLGVPLYATPFTAAADQREAGGAGHSRRSRSEHHPDGRQLQPRPFDIRFMPLAHSIPEMSALVIDTPYGKVFHTGDWKLDEQPVIGKPSTAAQLKAVGDEGILALVCDSTNAFNNEDSGSEGSVKADLLKAVNAAKGRVVVTTFASNAARLQTLAEVAHEAGRKLCYCGALAQPHHSGFTGHGLSEKHS